MRVLVVKREGTNIQALDETLRVQLGDDYLGLSTTPGEVRLHLREATPDSALESARVIVNNHDPARLSVSQQAAAERQRTLLQLRAGNRDDLSEADYDENAALLRLASKIRWLEQEIRDLRGIS